MTGLECLREELLKRGLTKQQSGSRVVAEVLDILANTDHAYSDLWGIEQDVKRIKQEAASERFRARLEIEKLEGKERLIEERYKYCQAQFAENKKYIESFLKMIEECETVENKDAMKKAQFFINNTNVKTAYDNTAFIIGLAAIISNGNVGAISTLKKINKDIPFIEESDMVDRI